MRRAIIFLSISVGSISLIRLLLPGSPLQMLGLDTDVAWLGFIVTSLGILCSWQWLRQLNLGMLFHGLALGLLTLTIVSLVSPSYSGVFASYVHMTDYFIAFESSIILWLLGSEQTKEASVLLYLGVVTELWLRNMGQRLSIADSLRHSHRHA